MLILKCVKSVPSIVIYVPSIVIYVPRCMFFLPRVCRLINETHPVSVCSMFDLYNPSICFAIAHGVISHWLCSVSAKETEQNLKKIKVLKHSLP